VTETHIPLTDARARIAELVGRAGYGGVRIVLTKHGSPAAALVPVADLDRLRVLDAAAIVDSPFVVSERVAIDRPLEMVWDTLLSQVRREQWWPELRLEDFVGGGMEERTGTGPPTRGGVLDLVAERLLGLSWRADGWEADTTVRVELAERAGSTLVHLTHTGWEQLVDGRRLADQHRAVWRRRLDTWRNWLTPAPADDA